MRIRLFNTYEPVTTLYRDLIPYWKSLGWHVEVVISKVSYRSNRDQVWRQHSSRIRETGGLRGVKNLRISKVFAMIFYIVSASTQTMIGNSVDRNVFLTQPPLFFIWGYLLKILRKQPYFIVLMDLYPDVAVQAGLINEDSLITQYFYKLCRFGLSNADGIIVIGRDMKQRVVEMGVESAKIHFVPNWADNQSITPIPHEDNDFREKQGWQDKFIILYSGNIGVSHFFDDILIVAKRWRNRPDVIFAFIGDGQRINEIREFKEIHNLQNIQLIPFQPQNQLQKSLGSGDLHFVSLRSGFQGLVVPSKVYGVMSAGRPILFQGPSDSEISLMIKENDIGVQVNLHDPNTLEKAIQKYLDSSALAADHGFRARKLVEEQYCRQRACRSYSEVIR